MKRKTIHIGITISLALLLACGLLAIPGKGRGVVQSAPANDDETTARPIEGTWFVIVTPPAGGPPAYLSIASFASGGVLVTSPDPSVGPSATSTGHGTWEWTKGNRFASTHVAFVYDSNGHITGTVKINSSYRLTGNDSFEGRGQLQFCDPSLNNCFTVPGCATLSGKRQEAEQPSCPQ
jgi:hypothetical protein